MNQIKHFAKNPKYDGYQGGLASVVHKFIDKKTSGRCIENENMSNEKNYTNQLRKN